MTVRELRDRVMAIPADQDRAVLIVTADGDILGVREIRIEDGTVIISASAVIPSPARP